MKLSLVIAALRARCPFFAGNVAGAAEFKSIPETGKMKLPAAYVVPTEDVTAEQRAEIEAFLADDAQVKDFLKGLLQRYQSSGAVYPHGEGRNKRGSSTVE